MAAARRSILVIGESNVGKTHFGAQLLKRLMVGDCALRMNGAATNLRPYEAAMNSLSEGMATGHTAATTYVESEWPIADAAGRTGTMIWPDYGGEQVRGITAERKVPGAWRDRVLAATDWVLLIRLHTMRTTDDVFSRPILALGDAAVQGSRHQPSDQARLIELLQMLLHVAGVDRDEPHSTPGLALLLTCWDELRAEDTPRATMQRRLPMLSSFIDSTWRDPAIFGLSALERPLSQDEPDKEYAVRGPERFGYVVLPDGHRSDDITLPIQILLERGDAG
ncbi:MAG: hypothetical protein ACRYGP_09195 [Janthinobacterium lividum]